MKMSVIMKLDKIVKIHLGQLLDSEESRFEAEMMEIS